MDNFRNFLRKVFPIISAPKLFSVVIQEIFKNRIVIQLMLTLVHLVFLTDRVDRKFRIIFLQFEINLLQRGRDNPGID